jgi:hypothetical protein
LGIVYNHAIFSTAVIYFQIEGLNSLGMPPELLSNVDGGIVTLKECVHTNLSIGTGVQRIKDHWTVLLGRVRRGSELEEGIVHPLVTPFYKS